MADTCTVHPVLGRLGHGLWDVKASRATTVTPASKNNTHTKTNYGNWSNRKILFKAGFKISPHPPYTRELGGANLRLALAT